MSTASPSLRTVLALRLAGTALVTLLTHALLVGVVYVQQQESAGRVLLQEAQRHYVERARHVDDVILRECAHHVFSRITTYPGAQSVRSWAAATTASVRWRQSRRHKQAGRLEASSRRAHVAHVLDGRFRRQPEREGLRLRQEGLTEPDGFRRLRSTATTKE